MARGSKAEMAVRPLASLREYATALEAGIALVLADPEKRTVHKLRTATRRVEAQLTLLAVMDAAGGGNAPDAGQHGPASKKLLKLLSSVRKAAGEVRDFDVQMEMIAEATRDQLGESLQDQGKELCAWLTQKRVRAAHALVAELQGHAHKLGPRIEAMMKSLKSREEQEISRALLLTLTTQVFTERSAPFVDRNGEKALHGLRKAAKMCRYLLEAGGGKRKAAAAFEVVQEGGGIWHDNLGLRVICAKRLGKKAELTHLFRAREDAALAAYKTLLAEMVIAPEALGKVDAEPEPNLGELAEKTHITRVKVPDVGDSMQDHGDALDAHAEGKS